MRKDLKKELKYIKEMGYISKPYWDKLMRFYDWKCLFCNHSWVGNPDVGYVRPKSLKSFITLQDLVCPSEKWYKNGFFVPCKEIEYNGLKSYNRSELQAAHPELNFDNLWENFLTRDDLNSNKLIQGGLYRDENKDLWVIGETEEVGGVFTKVVTLGERCLPPKKSIQCPVCQDLYRIICKEGYQPLNIFQKIRQEISWFKYGLSLKFRRHK